MVTVRRVKSWATPQGGPTDPLVGRYQRYAIAYAFMFSLLVVRKLASTTGLTFETVFGTYVAVIAALLVVHFVRQRRVRNTPEPVSADVELADETVESELRAGKLAPHDLVREGAVWVTLLQSMRFGEVASERDAVLARRAWVFKALAITVGTATGLGLLLVLLSPGEALSWLLAP